MQTRVRVPARRVVGLAITETADEVLIYDTERRHIHHLNATTSAVWRVCDGTHDAAEIARLASVQLGQSIDEATTRLALTKLDEANLLAQPLPTELRAARLSRRTFVRRAAIAGAIAVPAIASTTVPAFAAGSWGYCGGPCNNGKGHQCSDPSCPKCVSNTCTFEGCGAYCGSSVDCSSYAGCTYCNASHRCAAPPQGLVQNSSVNTLEQQQPTTLNASSTQDQPSTDQTTTTKKSAKQDQATDQTEKAPATDTSVQDQQTNQAPADTTTNEPATQPPAEDTSNQAQPPAEEAPAEAPPPAEDTSVQQQTDQQVVTEAPAEAPPPAEDASVQSQPVQEAPQEQSAPPPPEQQAAPEAPPEQDAAPAAPAEDTQPANQQQDAQPAPTEPANG